MDILCRVVLVLDAQLSKCISVLILQWRIIPFPLRFQKQSKGISPILLISDFAEIQLIRTIYPM